ncbi:hypothetical protein EIN_294490, partial [Entamoeba invadens IP1]
MLIFFLLLLIKSFGQPDKKKEEDKQQEEFPSLQPLAQNLPQQVPVQELPPRFRGRGRYQRPPFRPQYFQQPPHQFRPHFYPQQTRYQQPRYLPPFQQQPRRPLEIPQPQQQPPGPPHVPQMPQQTRYPMYQRKEKELPKESPIPPQTPQKEEPVVRPKTTLPPQKVIPPQQTPPVHIQTQEVPKQKEEAVPQEITFYQKRKKEREREAEKLEFPFLPPKAKYPNRIPVTPDIYPMKKMLETLSSYSMCKFYMDQFVPDFIVHSRYWLGELCVDGHCNFPVKTTVKEGFILHGYWPHYYKNRNLFCCTNFFGPDNAENMLLRDQDLIKEVNLKWMSIGMCRFAIYQWDKHGSCTMKLFKGPNGPIDYMRTALNLYDEVDIWELLQKSELKVEAGKYYERKELKRIFKNYF